ncbi:MAG TPA: efflux RND transporter periplasmic adaptor subunit [Gemmatimonadales bacterium]|nr:efflux RND transporter periplasmic adaptor subunit [Gemmatimonadales bacterium]
MTTAGHDLSRLRIDRDAPSPALRRALRRNVLLAVAAVVIIGVAVVVARRGSGVPVQAVVATALDAGPGGGGSGAGATAVTANGYVVARTRASVSAKVAGRLAYLGVSEGSYVRRGEVIARLENADYQAQVSQAEANVASARAQLIEAEADRDQLQREARRLQDIRARNAQLVSPQDVDAAESRAAQADARARSAQARIEAAEAGLRFAQASLENTLVLAPFTGTVLRKEAEVGEVVAPSVGGGLTRGAVVTMADLTTLEVEVDVNEAYIARVRRGQTARITLDAYPDTAFRGTVRQVVPTADRQRATVQVKVSILDHDPRILPEMGARVDFLEPDTASGRPAVVAAPRIRVPAAAVREQDGRTVVWLIRQGRLETRSVEAGPVSGGFREIRSGLAGGELVLVGGVETPRAGMRVLLTNP